MNGTLQFFPTAEGYVNVTRKKTSFAYNYVNQYKDHLGNNRLNYGNSVTTGVTIMNENYYYPFGLKHQNYNVEELEYINNPNDFVDLWDAILSERLKHNYKYNGKEWQDDVWLNLYDYGARHYDTAIGRWMNIDPLAELARKWSPFTYANDNPNYFIDPDGMMAVGLSASERHAAGMGEQPGSVLTEEEIKKKNGDEDKRAKNDKEGKKNDSDPPTKAQLAYLKSFYKRLRHVFQNNFEFGDAVWHYRLGNGASVDVNLASLDFGNLSAKDFENPDFRLEGSPGKFIRFDSSHFVNNRQALIYGTIEVVYIGDGLIMALPNKYDFDMKFEPGARGLMRDVATLYASQFNGAGEGYWINFNGVKKIRK